MELHGQLRSQIEFGNEERHRRGGARRLPEAGLIGDN